MRYSVKGYLTIYLALSLAVLLSLFWGLIRGAFINYSKMKLEIAVDIGMNSVLGEFHRELLNQYDLLFVDMTYGSENSGTSKLQNHLIGFIEKNITAANNSVSAWNELSLQSVTIAETLMPHHYDGKILKRQACAYISENIQVETMKDVGSLLTSAKTLDAKDEMGSWYKAVESIASILSSLTDEKRQRALAENPDTDVSHINVTPDKPPDEDYKNSIKQINNFVTADKKGSSITLKNYYSHREKKEIIIYKNGYDTSVINNVASDILFRAYLFEKIGYYKNEKAGALLDYQIEYVIFGENSDTKNLEKAKRRIINWRLADNVRLYFTDAVKKQEAMAAALLLTTVLAHPELARPVADSILFSWAYSDSIKDAEKILDGGKVPLIKKAIGSAEEGLSYRQYLEIMLLFEKDSKITDRVMDIIEMDIRQTPHNQNFYIDRCLESFRATVVFDDRFSSYSIDRRYGYY